MEGYHDGMGGQACGEAASFIAAAETSVFPFSNKDGAGQLADLCFRINQKICAASQPQKLYGMGTTAAMVLFQGKRIYICNVGDSRIFHFRDGKLRQISQDHVFTGKHSAKPPLAQFLGIPEDEMRITPYIAKGSYRTGDLYLICSDGLTDMLSEKEIEEILLSKTIVREAAEKMISEAMRRGGADNITLILCRIENGVRSKR